MTGYRQNKRIIGALVLVVGIATLTARADVVILKDGYTIYGVKTLKEKETILDKEVGESFVVEKTNGLTVIDDGPRWTIFPLSNLQVADVSNTNKFSGLTAYYPKGDRYVGRQVLPPSANRPKIGPWNDKEWTRTVEFLDADKPNAKHVVQQHVGVISPYYVRVGSGTHRLLSYFLLKEFGVERIRTFLENHPDLNDRAKPDPDKRERLIRFWIQADLLDEADKDLAKFAKDLPSEREKLEKMKAEINLSKIEKLMVEIEKAKDNGRHRFAMKALNEFPKDYVPNNIALKVTTLKAEYETRQTKFDMTLRFLKELPEKVSGPDNQFLKPAAEAISQELHLDTLNRLEMFTTLSDRAEQDAKRGRKPQQTPEELLSAAVTGWHLGKVSAEAKVVPARKCWLARQMAQEYFNNPNKRNRIAAMNAYEKLPDALPFDELEKLVSLLPPPEAPKTHPVGKAEMILPPSVDYPKFTKGVEYLLKLPDEYSPGRPYPLLVLLPDGFQKPEEMLQQFGDVPTSQGYIVAVLKWYDPLLNTYQYGKPEHMMCLNLIRTLKRTYQVDSDRVFLLGNGGGGSMAIDVAAGHPTMFAGVSAFNPVLLPWMFGGCGYWMNFQNLPTYIVMGDKSGASAASTRPTLEKWMPKGYPTLVVSYKGRGAEWFSEELPFIFDWMGRKRRAEPGKILGPTGSDGFDSGFRTVRSGDDRFHWISVDELHPACSVNYDKGLTGISKPAPAKLSAKITEGNQLQVSARGMKNITLWFGQGMFDYSKPIMLKVGERAAVKKEVKPNLAVLMEDLYERADRQRPFFEKIELKIQ